jgi:hypothetical protein
MEPDTRQVSTREQRVERVAQHAQDDPIEGFGHRLDRALELSVIGVDSLSVWGP